MNSNLSSIINMNSELEIIPISGILNLSAGQQLRQNITNLVNSGTSSILLDCSALQFMDSAGLGAVVMAFKSVREVNGQFGLCTLNAQVQMMLELTGMDQVFPIFSNASEFKDKYSLSQTEA